MARHVLVPIDGSEPAWKALEHAIENDTAERITVLHVVDPAEGVYAGAEGGYYDTEAFERAVDRGEELCQRARERVEETTPSPAVETTVETGRPARTIVDYADEAEVDHVVIGSHGREGFSRILLGSVAETVARRVPVPVTIVR